ncbi:hypothetical protein [Methylibium petroleiphilum]|uniref:Transmembrane protein n=1 Tax=Methylibium petroleiphilum (strain ATCC BAA-1232 / LMG 22953 / PM1) TaxID=420662 RepID=A2SMA8_METPP|nr:hypothetical protein [Methylibium petroleiphilum]ABM96697.1 hypothetical protein Mpe_A3744 [Methylibium petroleiphilum PM1]
MLAEITDWIEAHEVTVDLLKAAAVVLLAWASGAFSYLRRFRRKPRLEVASTASFIYVERPSESTHPPNAMRASFVVNASLVNASNEKIVLDHFELSYRSKGFWRSHRQRLLRLGFPARPRKRVGEITKYMSVWITEYPLDEIKTAVIDGSLEPKESCGGYLLFTSFTYGAWNPKIKDEQVHVRLRAKLTSQQWLSKSARLRVVTDPAIVEEFSPGFVEHVAHESTWNHDLSVRR